MNDILNEILPETYKKGYFYNNLTDKDKIISFLRSVININYENCMNTIDTNKQLNKFCYDEVKNINKRGNVYIGNIKLYDYFEEKCYYRNKLLTEDCKHKGFFLISETKNKFNKYLKNELNFSDKTINEINKYIDSTKIKKIKKITSSILTADTPNFSYITPTRNSYKNSLVETPGLLHIPKTIPPVISSINTINRKHTHTNKINNWREQEETLKRQSQFIKNRLSKVISRKMRENPNSLLSYKLHEICNDSGYCIAFGKKTELIKKLFDDFNNPKFIKSITTVSSGRNGKLLEILFERYKYKAYTILKIIKEEQKEEDHKYIVDNLVYEYLVGKYLINNYYKKVPCFLETYGIIYNKHILNIKKHKNIFKIENIIDSQIEEILKYGCINSKYFGLVLEYVKNPKTFEEELYNNTFWCRDLLNILFQIYYTLYLMRNVFTHYDLHTENILLFKPKENHYIQYHFHTMGKVISFKSYYLVKIIDYGRCSFINKKDNINSESIYQDLCNIKECNNIDHSIPCGALSGYRVSYPEEPNDKPIRKKHYTELRKLNRSHDLRILKEVGNFFENKYEKKTEFLNQIKGIYKQYIYLLFYNVIYLNYYGTAENMVSGLIDPKLKINNIMDAFFVLKELYNIPEYLTKNNEFYKDIQKLGDLYIYDDGRDMEFIEI